jgi:2-polyprenyl-3-methyl-5-hydroxy-6-metoxy-1,4-benzoquinol methylase
MTSPASESLDEAIRRRRTGGYESPRADVLAHVPVSARCILEFGCSTGALGSALKARQQATVVGVEIDPAYAADAQPRLDRVVVSDVEAFLRGPTPAEAPFDCLIAADILEHLIDPWNVLRRAVDLLAPRATVIVSLPNVICWRGMWEVLRTDRWPRHDQGVFDRTHLRWFTRTDAIELLRDSGLRPYAIEPRYWASGWRLKWRLLAAKTPLHRFLPLQYIVCAVKE